MDHVALSSTIITKPSPFRSISIPSRTCLRLPANTTVSCKATTDMGVKSTHTTTNFYGLLSIRSPKSARSDDIKRAYRTMALRYHPDVCQDVSKKEESTKMFVQLNEAYKTLSDPVLRREYDFELGLISSRSLGRDIDSSFSNTNSKNDRGEDSERGFWYDQTAEVIRRAQEEASELRRRSSCRIAKRSQNRMRR